MLTAVLWKILSPPTNSPISQDGDGRKPDSTHGWSLGGPSQFWVVRQSAGTMESIEITYIYFSECYPLDVLKQ